MDMNFEEIGKATVCFHVTQASYAAKKQITYVWDIESFAQLVERHYNDYYGAGNFYLKNEDEDEHQLPDEEWKLVDGQGKVYLQGRDEIEAETGTLNIDGDFDRWHVKCLEDCNDQELKEVYKDGHHHILHDKEMLAYICAQLGKKMIDTVEYHDGMSCTVKFTDGSSEELAVERGQNIEQTINDFLDENDVDEKSRKEWSLEIELQFEATKPNKSKVINDLIREAAEKRPLSI